MSKRLTRLTNWIEANPYCVYASRGDCISDEQAAHLLAGEFEAFNESIWEWEVDASDYADWREWEAEFADIAGYDEWDNMPEWLRNHAIETRYIDTSDLIEGAIRAWRGHVIAWPMKRNGEYIYAPSMYGDKAENAARMRYIRRDMGFTGQIGAGYEWSRLTVVGTLSLWDIYESQRAPQYVTISKSDTTLFHEPWNGAGDGYYDSYYWRDKPRRYKAKFYIDGQNPGYGVDSIFGLSGSCWSEYLTVD